MTAWLKIFTDGAKEHGSDEDIAIGNASWTQGRLDNIKEVVLFHKLKVCSLSIPNTSWHQFDRFSVIVSEGTQQPTRTHRIVQAEIIPDHVGLYLVCSDSGGYYSWTVVRDLEDTDKNCFYKLLTDKHVGKWLTVILPDRDYPRVTFSAKGKMYDNKHISK
jgi:hypothetical protein